MLVLNTTRIFKAKGLKALKPHGTHAITVKLYQPEMPELI